jgi:hypothetical protein
MLRNTMDERGVAHTASFFIVLKRSQFEINLIGIITKMFLLYSVTFVYCRFKLHESIDSIMVVVEQTQN